MESKNIKNRSISFYEQEAQDVLGAPPPRFIGYTNILICTILFVSTLFAINFKYPIVYETKLDVYPGNEIVDPFIVEFCDASNAKYDLKIRDRQYLEKGESIISFLDSTNNFQTIRTPFNGQFILFNHPQSINENNNKLGMVVPGSYTSKFQMVLNSENLNYFQIGSIVNVYSSKNKLANYSGKVMSFEKTGDQLFAIIYLDQPKNNLQGSNFIASVVVKQISILNYLF